MPRGSTARKLVYALIIVLAYIPFITVEKLNKPGLLVAGIPALWLFMMLWTLYVFALLYIAYSINRMYGG